MRKYDRQRIILSLIEENEVETQEQLTELLKQQGIIATQATISRDIKELRITKIQIEDGIYKYTVLETMHDTLNERLSKIFRSSVLSIRANRGQIIINTVSYAAAVTSLYLTNQKYSEIAGIIAGADTILVQVHENADIEKLKTKIEDLIY